MKKSYISSRKEEKYIINASRVVESSLVISNSVIKELIIFGKVKEISLENCTIMNLIIKDNETRFSLVSDSKINNLEFEDAPDCLECNFDKIRISSPYQDGMNIVTDINSYEKNEFIINKSFQNSSISVEKIEFDCRVEEFTQRIFILKLKKHMIKNSLNYKNFGHVKIISHLESNLDINNCHIETLNIYGQVEVSNYNNVENLKYSDCSLDASDQNLFSKINSISNCICDYSKVEYIENVSISCKNEDTNFNKCERLRIYYSNMKIKGDVGELTLCNSSVKFDSSSKVSLVSDFHSLNNLDIDEDLILHLTMTDEGVCSNPKLYETCKIYNIPYLEDNKISKIL